MADDLNYHDKKEHINASLYYGEDADPVGLHISLPSDVWVSSNVARAFGMALIRLADQADLLNKGEQE